MEGIPSETWPVLLGAIMVYVIRATPLMYFIIAGVGYCVFSYLKRTATATSIKVNGQGVVITGCDTGFGHELALKLYAMGFTVFAGCLNPKSEEVEPLKLHGKTGRLHVIQLDVTKDQDVENCLQYVTKNCPHSGLWAVVNNAGINIVCDVEIVPLAFVKRVAEVNYFGMIRVTKAFIPLIRRFKGRFVNVTSVRGRIALPTCTCYTPSKWAGEAFSDILRREMARFDVKVAIIEPGNFGGKTGMLNAKTIQRIEDDLNTAWKGASDDSKEALGREYIDSLLHGLKECGSTSCPTLDPTIDAMVDAVVNTHPRGRYLVHGGKKMYDWYCVLATLNPFLPEWLMDYIIKTADPLPPVKAQKK